MAQQKQSMAAVILAGGLGRRMHGENKAFMTIQGRSFLDHILESLGGLLPVYLSVDEGKPYLQTGIPLIEDKYPGIGPMGGICSAMQECPEDALFIAACDMPFLRKETAEKLISAYQESPGKITLAWQGGRWHPLFAIWPKSVLPALLEEIRRKEYSFRKLVDTQEVQYVILEEHDRSVVNLNSPQEFAAQVDGELLEVEDAVSLLRSAICPVTDTEQVPLMQALGRVLAENIIAQTDQPPFPRSPLDGYALRAQDSESADPEHPATLQVIGKIFAGQTFDGCIGPGQCVRLMTGAPIPKGADTVVRQEDTDYGEKKVRIFAAQKAWRNYCLAGDDYHAGTLLLKKESRITAVGAAVAAGAGKNCLQVYRRPKIAVISTGDEILPAGEPLMPGKIYDTNLPFVTGRLSEIGGTQVTGMHGADEADHVAQQIRTLVKENDLIITTGGVSVGEKDIMHDVLKILGAQKLFWRVNVKPGAPTLAFVTEDTLVICLTGNPFGVMVNFELLVRPVLEKLSGGAILPGRKEKLVLTEDVPKKADVRRFLKGIAENGTVRAVKGSQDAGTISPMAQCNCYIELLEGSAGRKGDTVWAHIL